MISIRRSQERGRGYHGWLDSRHTFSFAGYLDREHMGFRALRVLNEDRVRAGAGFPTHGHRDMEIVSYVVEGALEHEDSLGTGSVIRPGEIQRMSAGQGIYHSEMNGSRDEDVHFLQIWIVPERQGLAPGYEQKRIDLAKAREGWTRIASREGGDGEIVVHQDVAIHTARPAAGTTLRFARGAERHLWLQVVRGSIELASGEALTSGDAASTSDEPELVLQVAEDAELLLFDLA